MADRDPWATHTDPDRWTAIRCPGTHLPCGRRPEPGEVFGLRYGAWRVVEVRVSDDVDLTDDDRELMNRYKPEYRERYRPYAVVLDHIGGPNLMGSGRTRVHLDGLRVEWVLLGERYPVCSCHGHPWPCQDADRDRVATLQAKVMDEQLAKAVPGVCPSCGEPITHRQKTVTYPGENVDVPGGPEPRFHTRRGCLYDAERYEERWLAVDPRRERILTWPVCPGPLIVHGDGSSECRRPVPDCQGHLTHDHGTRSACYAASSRPCPRGCSPDGHPGVRTTPRPIRIPFGELMLP